MATPWNLGPAIMDFSALGNLGKTYQSAVDGALKRDTEAQKRQVLASLGSSGDYATLGQKLIGLGDIQEGAALIGLGQKADERKQEQEFFRNFAGTGNAGVIGVPTGVAPARTSSDIGSPNEIETKFVDTVKSAGLTNPVGLAAVAAYGRAESGYSPGNVNRTWSDPSESGQAGTSGGIMSWRAERLQNLQNFAKQRGEAQPSVETQALFLAQEDPQLIPRLNAARTPEEANQVMANAWKFAGYDRPGGENARRLALTRHYASRFGGSGAVDAASGQPIGARPVQVAENEADVQRLEAAQAGTAAPQVAQGDIARLEAQANALQQRDPEAARQLRMQVTALRGQTPPVQAPGAAPGGMPVQVAQAAPQPGAPVSDAPNLPDPTAANAQAFIIPGTGEVVDQQTLADNPRLQSLTKAYAAAPTERARAFVKQRMELEMADIKQKQEVAKRDEERRYQEGKTPEAVREWKWAKDNGLTEAKSPVAYAKEKADATRADTAPVTRQIKQPDSSEVAVQWNPETRRWDPLTAPEGGLAVRPTGQKLTEGQSKDLVFHNRGLQALETFEPVADAYAVGIDRLASQVPGGNYVVPEKFQMAQQAGRNFLASILRKDSGAAITAPEEAQYGGIFLPQPGDKPGTLAQKAEARKQAIDAIRNGLGTAEVLALGQRLTTRNPGDPAAPKPSEGGWQDIGGGIRIREKR